jgi:hypothetical protein
MKIRYACLYLLLLITNALHAEIYKWEDANGNVHFSDKSHPGAKTITVQATQTYSPPASNVLSTPPRPPDQAQQILPERKPTTYTEVVIVEPKNQETIRSNTGELTVLATTKPELDLEQGDQLLLRYDGKPYHKPQSELAFVLTHVYRGAHSLQVQIVDKSGRVLLSGDTMTIFIHHSRVGGGN